MTRRPARPATTRSTDPRPSRRALLAGTSSLLCPAVAIAQSPLRPTPAVASAALPHPIEIQARRIETFQKFSSQKRHGRLEFRGGLVLTCTDRDFGGLSGLVMESDGKSLLAMIDAGGWVTADVTYSGGTAGNGGGAGTPTGLVNARLGTIVALNGRTLTRKRDQDAEAIALLDGSLARGTVLIAFERNHRIGRFPIIDRVLQPPIGYLKMPTEVISRRVPSNKGFEAMTVMAGGPRKGAVIAFAERFPSPDGHHTGWVWANGEPQRLHVTDIDGFDVTDCASLTDGSLVMLERRFRWTEGVKMRLRLFKPDEIAPGKVADGTSLLTADLTSEIDNMEGLSVHRGPRGETILTLVSDDNFNSFLQRTILLQFALT